MTQKLPLVRYYGEKLFNTWKPGSNEKMEEPGRKTQVDKLQLHRLLNTINTFRKVAGYKITLKSTL